jgi:hypothetical protein
MKTKKDLLKVLKKSNPNGFVIIDEGIKNEHGDRCRLITNPANLNITSYSYSLDGKDITSGLGETKVIGFPFYQECFLTKKKSHRTTKISNETKPMEKYNRVYSIGKFIDMLEKFDNNAILISFDGYLIDDIINNGDYNIDFWTYINGEYLINCEPNDLVILKKGAKLEQKFIKPVKEFKENLFEYQLDIFGEDELFLKSLFKKCVSEIKPLITKVISEDTYDENGSNGVEYYRSLRFNSSANNYAQIKSKLDNLLSEEEEYDFYLTNPTLIKKNAEVVLERVKRFKDI